MNYSLIEGISPAISIAKMASSELAALSKLWKEKKVQLETSLEYERFIKKMKREWAIETGIIERLYSWDRGVTETLIEQGLDASLISQGGVANRQEAENITKIITDQQNIVEALFDFVKGSQPFSEHFIRSMHHQLTAHQDYVDAVTPDGRPTKIPLLKGEYKKQPNNPKRQDGNIDEYCPPELVASEMEETVAKTV